MKRKITLLFSFTLLGFLSVFGQITNLGQPKSWGLKQQEAPLPAEIMPGFDLDTYRAEDIINDAEKIGPWRFGFNHIVNYTLENSGTWTVLPNGDRIWRLRVKSKDALSLNFIFENMYIPNGGSIYIHKTDKSGYLGAYTSINNSESKILGTDLISGEDAIVEYYEPAGVFGQGTLTINTITHGYRDISLHENEVMKALNDSGDCNRDVECLTDAEPLWLDESHSVAMIVVGGNGSCTGTLVNNTSQDGTPYFLTANHCLGTPANWAFRFKWISPTPDCATTANSPNSASPTAFQTANGAILRASNAGSDVALVQITNLTLATAQAWGLYYAGWDHTGNAVGGAVGIHHPSGDIMKYCRENNALTQVTSGGAQCWNIANWDEGVTEPGSSGSGLWDFNHRLIGQLYGGAAACQGTNDNNQYDVYGRFDVSWDNGATAATRLSDWLDPNGITTGTLDGWDPNSPTVSLDAGIQSIESPEGVLCQTGDFTPEVTLRNYGSTTLTAVDINYSIDGGTQTTYNWTGSLASGATETIILPAQSVADGAHTFEAITDNPNGGTDENTINDERVSNFTAAIDAQIIDFELMLDCWGSETTWFVEDDLSNVVLTGGPYSDGTGGTFENEEWCLATGCYTFTIEDSYGDGMYGSQYGSCTFDGTYAISQNGTVLAEILAVDSDFGDIEENTFCVESSFSADFSSDTQEVCAGETVNFTDESNGSIVSWEWIFEGGNPAISSDENPVVTYAAAGTYNVTLTVNDGSGDDVYTVTDYITVNALPATPTITAGETTICAGSSTDLTSSYATGNEWSTNATTASISVNSAGSYSVTHTDANGCSATSLPTAITVQSLPVISQGTLTTPSTCGTATGAIQVNGSGSGDVSWSGTASGTANGVTLPYSISGLAAGSYNIVFTSTAGCGSNTLNVALSDPTPPATPTITVNGSTTFCQGESVELVSSEATGNTWSNSLTTSSIVVTTAGTYSVTFTDVSGCSASSTPVVVTVNTNPTAPVVTPNGATSFCDGGSVTLVSSVSTGIEWSTGATSNSIVANATDDYFVTVTDGNGCEATSNVVSVTENTLPTVTFAALGSICDDAAAITLTGGSPSGGVYSGPGVSGGTFNPATAGVGAHVITYVYEDGNGCEGSATSSITVDGCSSLLESLLANLKVYPNPSNGILMIELEGDFSFELMDARGRLVESGSTSNSVELNIVNYNSGIYFVNVTSNEMSTTIRVVKN